MVIFPYSLIRLISAKSQKISIYEISSFTGKLTVPVDNRSFVNLVCDSPSTLLAQG